MVPLVALAEDCSTVVVDSQALKPHTDGRSKGGTRRVGTWVARVG
jgi:hypothetical protein